MRHCFDRKIIKINLLLVGMQLRLQLKVVHSVCNGFTVLQFTGLFRRTLWYLRMVQSGVFSMISRLMLGEQLAVLHLLNLQSGRFQWLRL